MSDMILHTSPPPVPASRRTMRIIICDSNPVLAEGIQLILQKERILGDFVISVGTGISLSALAELAPNVVIVDPWQVTLPGESVAKTFANLSAATSLIGYCSDITADEAGRLSHAGFRGLMPKTVQSEELGRIVIAVAFGGVYLHDSYSDKKTGQRPVNTDPRDAATDLTGREAEVLRHVALGSSMKEIASLMQISTKTVDTYKTRANQKLNLRTRSDIVRYAIQSGWMN